MNQHKGFSLVEVLVSLWLVTVVTWALIQQQVHSRQMLTQLVLRQENLLQSCYE